MFKDFAPQIICILFFITLLLVHAALTNFVFTKKGSMFIKKEAVTKPFLAAICVLFFGFLLAVCMYDVFSTTESEMFTLLRTLTPTYVNCYRGLDVADYDILSPLTTTLLLVCIAALYYTVQFTNEDLSKFVVYLTTIYVSGVYFITAQTTLSIFIAYELLLLPSSLMIDRFSKTARGKEATYFMIVWTQIGAVCLFVILALLEYQSTTNTLMDASLSFSRSDKNIIISLAFFGFGTKMPVWPFYWWLPEAHVEVTTSFSIVLSGVSVKFAFLGFIRFVSCFGAGDVYWIFVCVALFGFMDAILKVDSEADIKKIVAYQTVAEMHVLVVYVSLDFSSFINFVYYVFPTHCWISTLSFILVDIISKRYHSRNLEHLYGIFYGSPLFVKFVYLTVFIFGSIPGSFIFSVEFYVQIAGSSAAFNFIIFMFLQLSLVVFSKNIWWVLCGGDLLAFSQARPFTMTRSETLFVYILLLQLIPAFGILEILY